MLLHSSECDPNLLASEWTALLPLDGVMATLQGLNAVARLNRGLETEQELKEEAALKAHAVVIGTVCCLGRPPPIPALWMQLRFKLQLHFSVHIH